tara:strand:- start:6173 stop:7915 length:1743 start_codon:yes stop_codon:yes gene_type:complete
MANKNINLKKKIISNQESNTKLEKNFKKLAKTEDPIDQDRIKEIYNSIFYKIRKKGNVSHQHILEQSYNHIHFSQNKRLDNKIDRQLNDLKSLNEELTKAEIPDTKENSVYEDGSFLMAGENGGPYQDMDIVWVMQEGRKRQIYNVEVYNIIRKAYNLEIGQQTGIYFLTVEELNMIPDGTEIHSYIDLNTEGDDLIAEGAEIELLSAYYEAEFYCEGNEVSDTSNVILDDNGAAQGQFLVNNEGCKIKFLVDNGTVDEILPEIVEFDIPKGEYITQRFVRETAQFNNSGMPANIHDLYSSNSPEEMIYNTVSENFGEQQFPVTDYIREWGPTGKFTGILYAQGRINYRELKPINEESTHILNGLPSSPNDGSFWQVVNVTDLQETTPYGTKRIFPPGSNLWGSLNQELGLQNHFNDFNFAYYKTQVSLSYINLDLTYLGNPANWVTGDSIQVSGGTFPVYGQPIIRYNNTYNVVLTIKYKNWSNIAQQEWFLLYDLVARTTYTKRRSSLSNAGINLDIAHGSNYISRIKWENATKSLVKFTGLKGYGTTGYNTTGVGSNNPFNPNNGGSNFEINSYNTL